MRTLFFSLLTFSMVLDCGIAAEVGPGNARPLIAAAPVLDDRYPRHVVEFGAVESHPDLVFSTLPGFRPLRLDLYKPRVKASGGHPLVVYVHGGGWQSGHTRHSGAFANWPGVLASLASKGYVVASIEYRLSGEAPFPAAFDDVKAALVWLRSRADAYGIDPTKAVIWGGSAGGHLAALTAVTCDSANPNACVQGFVAWYGVLDIAAALEQEAARNSDASAAGGRFIRCEARACDPKRVTSANPIEHVDAKDPPALLVHGRADAVVAVDQSIRFDEAMRARGAASTLKIIEGVDHSFIGSTPEQTRAASLDALDATFSFIERTLGGRK